MGSGAKRLGGDLHKDEVAVELMFARLVALKGERPVNIAGMHKLFSLNV